MKKRARWLWLCFWIGSVTRGQATSQPAQIIPPSDRWSSEIEFSIPGSRQDAVSHAIVVLPADYSERGSAGPSTSPESSATRRWSVVYLLHGYTGNCFDWYVHTSQTDRFLPRLASLYRVIIVLPDGKASSWYLNALTDRPDPADWQWETVMTKYLVPEIDKRFRTRAEPAGRGIAGLSMGGHGALYLAARHPELFGVCSSMSGVMDLTASPQKYDLAKRLGPYDEFPTRWAQQSVMQQCEKFVDGSTGILVDCGWSDAFAEQNRTLHAKLMDLHVPHDYIERPGGHGWEYWVNALPYHLQFMADHFRPAGDPKPPS